MKYRCIVSEFKKKKIGLENITTLTLASIDENNRVTHMSPKEFLASSLTYRHDPEDAKEFIGGLFRTLPLNQKIELNCKMRKMPTDAFEAKLKLLIDFGVKLTKRGIKISGDEYALC